MNADAWSPPAPLLVSRDARLVETALAAAAAAGVEPVVVRDMARVRALWRSAPVVLVGCELAPMVAGIALEQRAGVHLIGPDLDSVAAWSAPLQASVLVLPEQSALLTQVLDQQLGSGGAVVLRLVGGSGGLGVSTLCCALAQQAERRGLRAAVVELDPTGGGLDLVLGAETAPGWRWPELRAAAGHLDALAGNLPNVSGVDIVSHARPGPDQDSEQPPGAEAVRAVVGSLARTHDLVVLDGGAGPDSLLEAWPGQRQLLLCGADVRGVVAARARARAFGLHDLELVVRTGAARRLPPQAVGEALGCPVLGHVGDDRAVTRAAESGVPVARGRRGYAGQVARLLDAVVA
ncbi:septum site-determining protein Ssd [Luteococcus peritonei]|uniref:Septum site-determining protein Ssd n=1 Tax=Luteococcus peritonei TaxID=88874 RepID=A0ABW4RX75_9ACTN